MKITWLDCFLSLKCFAFKLSECLLYFFWHLILMRNYLKKIFFLPLVNKLSFPIPSWTRCRLPPYPSIFQKKITRVCVYIELFSLILIAAYETHSNVFLWVVLPVSPQFALSSFIFYATSKWDSLHFPLHLYF